jgi:hypothetical protein
MSHLMTREEQLQYCKICSNQSFSFEQGIICRLTNQQATFQTTCESFEQDLTKVDEQKRERNHKRIDQNGDFYPTEDLTPIIPRNIHEATFGNSSKLHGFMVILTFGLGGFFLYTAITELEMNNRWLMYLLSVLSLTGTVFYYRQFADRTTKLAFNTRGVRSESQLILWSSIIDSKIHIVTHDHLNSEYLILNLTNGTEEKIEITFLEGTPKKVGGVFEYFRQKAKSKT